MAETQSTGTTRTVRATPIVRTTASGRPIAAGGLRRAAVGLVVGAVAGLVALAARRSGRR